LSVIQQHGHSGGPDSSDEEPHDVSPHDEVPQVLRTLWPAVSGPEGRKTVAHGVSRGSRVRKDYQPQRGDRHGGFLCFGTSREDAKETRRCFTQRRRDRRGDRRTFHATGFMPCQRQRSAPAEAVLARRLGRDSWRRGWEQLPFATFCDLCGHPPVIEAEGSHAKTRRGKGRRPDAISRLSLRLERSGREESVRAGSCCLACEEAGNLSPLRGFVAMG
jgi:hypothetical protein